MRLSVPTITRVARSVVITGPTGCGAETFAQHLATDAVPWFKGDSWGSRPDGKAETWTYKWSSFDLPGFPCILTMTDGSDLCPERYLKKYHPELVTIRLWCPSNDLLERRRRWRREHGLPCSDDKATPVSAIASHILAHTSPSVDFVVPWLDERLCADSCATVLSAVSMFIQGIRSGDSRLPPIEFLNIKDDLDLMSFGLLSQPHNRSDYDE